LGQNVVVPESVIIGIFDLDNTTNSHITRKFLSEAEKAGSVISISDELPNSFVVCSGEETPRRMAPSPTIPPSQRAESASGKGAGTAGGADEGVSMKIYLSQLSSQTLLKRSETMRFE